MFHSRRKATEPDSGASAVEYGLLIAAIAAVIVIVIFALGSTVRGLFSDTCSSIRSNAGATTATGTC